MENEMSFEFEQYLLLVHLVHFAVGSQGLESGAIQRGPPSNLKERKPVRAPVLLMNHQNKEPEVERLWPQACKRSRFKRKIEIAPFHWKTTPPGDSSIATFVAVRGEERGTTYNEQIVV